MIHFKLFLVMLLLLSVGLAFGQNTFSVTNNGITDYLFDGTDLDPNIDVIRGETYTFNVSATGHPFWIKTSPSIGTGDQYNEGVTNNGDDNGTITWTVPLTAPSQLYYNCQFHAAMSGLFIVNDAVPVEMSSFTAAAAGRTVTLLWQTQTETDNFGFDIERSWDRDSWTKVGFMAGRGTTVEPHKYEFSDDLSAATGGSVVFYRLKQVDTNGTFEYSAVISASLSVPETFRLEQNYPNPFNPSTRIDYALPAEGFVNLKVYNLVGREVRTLVNETQHAGHHSAFFDAGSLASGIYYYRLQIGTRYAEMKKMLLVR